MHVRLFQIGSYYGSEIAPVDIDGDGITDNLLVAAPMFFSGGLEKGKVYIYRVTELVGINSSTKKLQQIQRGRHMQGLISFGPSGPLHRIGSAPAQTPDIPSNFSHTSPEVSGNTPQTRLCCIPAPQLTHLLQADIWHMTMSRLNMEIKWENFAMPLCRLYWMCRMNSTGKYSAPSKPISSKPFGGKNFL